MPIEPLLPTTERALLQRLASEQAAKRVPSLVAAVVRDGRIAWSGGRGRVAGEVPGVDTQYRIGSITKTFVAVLVMRLRDEGKVALNAPYGKYVPGTAFGDVTVAQLLAHAAGLTAESPGQWWERTPGVEWTELSERVTEAELKHRPGRQFHYTNLGYGALGELVARLRGVSWLDALNAEILQPLGMTRTTPMPEKPHADGFAVHPWADVLLPEPAHDAVAMAPAGQLWSTLNDLSRWARFLGGDTDAVLHPDTVAEMREPAVVEDAEQWTSGHGLGLQLARNRGRKLAGHTGSMPGFLATVWTHAESGTAGIAMANTTTGADIPGLCTDLIDIVGTLEPQLPAEWAPLTEVDPELLALTGTWYWGPAGRSLRLLRDGWISLTPIAGGGRASRFRPVGRETWIGLDGYYAGETLRVVRRPDGSLSHLDLATFIFTREPYDPSAEIPGGVDPDGWQGR
ncbi:CubicO group peptidase (beta-lactamase class C family) [Kutzneria buriramensis]|uniref:CubicO group peptidase (Beta-lactamase class C family) n=1 Tax=Kutzneria buriramensis TaxID=1045776 RepID=A0A3E0HQ10_9PSEU|nr:CubicO group peptidase (beta-lactamase class C family) [Kutzneria buriramensis]